MPRETWPRLNPLPDASFTVNRPLYIFWSVEEKRSSSSIIGKCVLQVPTTSKDEVLCFSAAAAQCSTVEKTTAEQSCFAFANELSHNLLEEAIFLRIALAGMDLLTAIDVSLQLAEKANRLCTLNVAEKPKLRAGNIFHYLLLRPKVQFLLHVISPPIIANWETQWTRKSHASIPTQAISCNWGKSLMGFSERI